MTEQPITENPAANKPWEFRLFYDTDPNHQDVTIFAIGITEKEIYNIADVLGNIAQGVLLNKIPVTIMAPEDKTPQTFEQELSDLINRHSKENGSDTPDFILASYLTGCLEIFNRTAQSRTKWYGKLTVLEGGLDQIEPPMINLTPMGTILPRPGIGSLDTPVQQAYLEYAKLPLATNEGDEDPVLNPDTNEIYSNNWCVHQGLSFVAPHPHRHYTYLEFCELIKRDNSRAVALRKRFNIPEIA